MPKDFKPDPLDKTIYIFKTENGKNEEKPQSKVVKVEEPKPAVNLEDTTPNADEKAKSKTQEESVKEVKADVASKKEDAPKGDAPQDNTKKKRQLVHQKWKLKKLLLKKHQLKKMQPRRQRLQLKKMMM